MTDLVYDGSFDGFLCAVARCLRVAESALGSAPSARGGDPSARDDVPPQVRIVSMEERVPDLFSGEQPLATDPTAARDFKRMFVDTAGAEELETLLLVHSSNDPRRHELLRDYVRMTLAAGVSVADRMGVPLVLAVQKTRNRVTWEIGKLMGFIRFRKAGTDLWYAPVEPEANVVGFIGPHFADRFPDGRLLIHDTRRGIGFSSVRGTGGIVDLRAMPDGLREALRRDSDPLVQSQWRAYFDSVAIPERRNPRLQDRNMPRRYWKNLVEKPGSAAMGKDQEGPENGEGDARGTCRGCAL